MHGFSHARYRKFSNITNARVAFYLLHPDRLRGPGAPGGGRHDPPPPPPDANRTSCAGGCEAGTISSTRDPSPNSSDEYWAATPEVSLEDFIEVDRRLATLRLQGSPVANSRPVSSVSSLSHSTAIEQQPPFTRPPAANANVNVNAEAGSSSGARQENREKWYLEGDEQQCPDRSWYSDKYFVVIVGLSPGVYRHM